MTTNALVHEKSPYLRQHATNPVDWLPWGEAAFEKARSENKPIFLSIGYSTCHWCHVMAHESFESEETAEVLNRFFVPIKLDREERPDVDRIYMLFVQATTGSGGWPMSVWLTPDLKPFYGGTYYPPLTKYGRPGFRDLLLHLARAWEEDRANIETSSASVLSHLQSMGSSTTSDAELSEALFLLGSAQLARSFDERYGGFGAAPKFPRPVSLTYLLRVYARTQDADTLDMVTETLRAMANGGMHDQIGGGFHRYSVDERWFVPHFEKMLYDQAQLAIVYLEAFQITGDAELARVARGILDYVVRDMTDPDGGFYSAEDADSPDPEDPKQHGEGAFYVWRKQEIDAVLATSSAEICRFYGVKAEGNVENDPHLEFTGRNILYRSIQPEPADLSESAAKLFGTREKRPRPHLDNKVLASWNGLMISAFARAAGILGEPSYLAAAERSAQFLLRAMYDQSTGRLLRRYCEGEAAVPGFADDYAFVAQAMLDLFEANSNVEYLATALDLAKRGLLRFEDDQAGGFFSTEKSASDVLLRLKDDYDGAEPSANSVAADVLLRLAHLTGEENFQQRAERTLRDFAPKLRSQPTMAPQMASALGRWLSAPEQVVLRYREASERSEGELQSRRKVFSPNRVVLGLSDHQSAALLSTAPSLAGLQRRGKVDLFECRNLVCDLPQILD